MFKKFNTNSHLNMLLSGLIFTLAFFANSFAQLTPNVAPYDCFKNEVSRTLQIDADSDNVYDTYGFMLCNADTVNTYTLKAIGDISKWPPLGFPTRSLVFNNSSNGISLLETYFDNSGNIIAWFQKSANKDTVFFHEGDTDYNAINFTYDSSSYYIQAYPNPADDFLKIHYKVTSTNSNVEIQLLTYEGNFITDIINAPQGQGDYSMVFPVKTYTSGYYRLRYITGNNNYFVSVAIVH